MRRRLRVALVPLAIALAAGSLASADTPESRLVTVVDRQSGNTLTVDTAIASTDLGRFTFKVPGLGTYVGNAGSGASDLSAHSFRVDFTGDAVLRPLVAPDGTVIGSVDAPRTVHVDLKAHIDPTHRTGQATLRSGKERHHLVAPKVGSGDLRRTMRAVESAIMNDDPAALYVHTTAELQAGYSAAAFAEVWAAQGASVGRVTAMRAGGAIEPQVNELGFVFASATYEVDRIRPDGVPETKMFEMIFLLEGDTWKLLFTRAQ